jgi:hypothetical protein
MIPCAELGGSSYRLSYVADVTDFIYVRPEHTLFLEADKLSF